MATHTWDLTSLLTPDPSLTAPCYWQPASIQSSLTETADLCKIALGDPGGTPSAGAVTLHVRLAGI